MKKEAFGTPVQVLGTVANKVAIGAVISADGVTANANGQKIVPAGTPVGGDTSALTDEQAVLKVSDDAKAQGILEHDVDVTAGNADGTLIINGYINENRLPSGQTISEEAKTALAPHIVFFKRN